MLQHATKKSGQIHVDLGNELKLEAETILKKMGLSVSEAVRIFLRQVIIEHEIPFNVHFTAKIPNEETKKAIAEIESGNVQKLNGLDDIKKMWDQS